MSNNNDEYVGSDNISEDTTDEEIDELSQLLFVKRNTVL